MRARKAIKQKKQISELPIAHLSHKKMLQLDRNYERSATVAELVYVSDSQPGITRLKKGRGYVYMFQEKPVRKKEVVERIRKLVIPPAWTGVWICPIENGHLQATGYDLRKRKQYRYHALWSMLRNETKFHRLYEFGKELPNLRDRLEQDLSAKELTDKKVIATVISLMERTCIRVGNGEYERLYGSHGLTTMKDKHVEVNGDKINFSFTGKKGKVHDISLKNKRLARIVQHCRDIPGKELFQYLDAEGKRRPIDSGMINSYIREVTGKDFSSRDFRTWSGTLHMLVSLNSIGEAATQTQNKQNLVKALDEVSLKLGNTRTVCRKYYVHPGLINLYEQNNLQQYFKQLEKAETKPGRNELTKEEEILMKILQSFHN
jgi:DNA topoisomerase-1